MALAQDTAYEQIFDRWFPGHRRTLRFDSTDKCFAALEKGEVDFVMASRYLMLSMTHYYEKTGFKVNILFEHTYFSSFGLNKNEAVLRSIISKAQKLVDTARIADQWTRRVFDYNAKLARVRLPYTVGLAVMLAVIMVLLLALLQRNRRSAGEMAAQAEIALNASRVKSEFLARMSHEIRTPISAVIGISEMDLMRGDLPKDLAGALNKIRNSGHTLLGIINDILDLSKIETGKLELSPEEYDLACLINDAMQLNVILIGSKPVEFALDMVRAGKEYDIIFLDHMMPDMDGTETINRLREMGYQAPVVALTANATTGNDKMFRERGFDDFISKPIDLMQLDAVLKTYVKGRRAGETKGL